MKSNEIKTVVSKSTISFLMSLNHRKMMNKKNNNKTNNN